MTPSRTLAEWSPHPPLLRLPGQDEVAAGPLDLTAIHVAHWAVRRDLTDFAFAVAHTPAGERGSWAALATRWALFARGLRSHQQVEDAGLWPLLEVRADLPRTTLLAALAAQRQEVDELVESCAAGLTRLADRGDDDLRAALAVRVHAAKESVARQLRHEELDALPLAQQLVTPEEWRRLQHQHAPGRNVTPGGALPLVPWALHGLPATAQQALLRRSRPVERLVWHLTHAAFERQQRRVFRHPGD